LRIGDWGLGICGGVWMGVRGGAIFGVMLRITGRRDVAVAALRRAHPAGPAGAGAMSLRSIPALRGGLALDVGGLLLGLATSPVSFFIANAKKSFRIAPSSGLRILSQLTSSIYASLRFGRIAPRDAGRAREEETTFGRCS
jgi:hypothetical protein